MVMDEDLIKAIVRQCGGQDVTFDNDSANDLEQIISFIGEQDTLEDVQSAVLQVRAAISVAQYAQPGAASR
jgi:hypothetical protein